MFASPSGLNLIGTIIEVNGTEAKVLCGNEIVKVQATQVKVGDRVTLKVDLQSLELGSTVDPLNHGE